MARILIHPGEHLADELKALGMSANELAKELGVPTNRLTEIIRGKRGISGDTALRLGRWFGTGPDIWMNLQKNYELRLAAQEIGDALQKIPEHHDGGKVRGTRCVRRSRRGRKGYRWLFVQFWANCQTATPHRADVVVLCIYLAKL